MKLREYQIREVERALRWLSSCGDKRRLAVAPTGTGKGTIKLALLATLRRAGARAVLLSPSREILLGLASRVGGELPMYTPTRYMNQLDRGECERAHVVLIDEAHEWVPTNQLPARLERSLPEARWLGYTATPYRGSYRSTQVLLSYWGDPQEILPLDKAIALGYYVLPEITVIPLIEDDGVEVVNGEFSGAGLDAIHLEGQRLKKLADLITSFSDRRIIVSVATSTLGRALEEEIPYLRFVDQRMRREERDRVYQESKDGITVIAQLGVLYRGADLPWLKLMIDVQPTLSPTRWMQTVGRLTRPPGPKSLIVTNRNFDRHGYLFAGVMPHQKMKEALSQWPDRDNRYPTLQKWLGFERYRKFWTLRTTTGRTLLWFRFMEMRNKETIDYGALVCPVSRKVLWGKRYRRPGTRGWIYTPWKRCEPVLVTGLRSGQTYPPTVQQLRAWEYRARRWGLAGEMYEAEQLNALRFLSDLRIRLEA